MRQMHETGLYCDQNLQHLLITFSLDSHIYAFNKFFIGYADFMK